MSITKSNVPVDLPEGQFVNYRNDRYYRINNYDRMDPFFMTLTSPSDHWLFISSTGGLTAGRKDRDNALFPYYTVDKITENRDNTGGLSLFHLTFGGTSLFWKPFEDAPLSPLKRERYLYKNICGNSLVFQEILVDEGLSFEVEWTTSPRFGLVRRCRLENRGQRTVQISLLDGVINTLPAFVTEQVQSGLSNLLDAYKRNELIPGAGVGIFSLSATLTDKAEPSESLRANTWCQAGLDKVTHLLSEKQVRAFVTGGTVEQEEDVKGYRGAYLVKTDLSLAGGEGKDWTFCGEVNQDLVDLELLEFRLNEGILLSELEDDLEEAKKQLREIMGQNDGLQATGNELTSAHHFTNVMFNVMRGGYFVNGYKIEGADLARFVQEANKPVYERNGDFFDGIKGSLSLEEIEEKASARGDSHLLRLVREYLPVTFSRRHGDPSRPWNRFSINTKNPDGTPKIDFQGNWRDIFQNWEALLVSSPRFVFSVIDKFLNATTADGYNPYRISRSGIDWERPEPDNPWANIGYWSDHQIIYLLKLMELAEKYYPGEFGGRLLEKSMVHGDVPYELRPYEYLKKDPRNSILFNRKKDGEITKRSEEVGFDGRLCWHDGEIVQTSRLEKLMILLLAKCTNFIPDGGIWMNTQRPEWNDANNALVGEGISVVTLSYLVRYLKFLIPLVEESEASLRLSHAVIEWMEGIEETLVAYEKKLSRQFTPAERQEFVDRIGRAGGKYRRALYEGTVDRSETSVHRDRILIFLRLQLSYFEVTLTSSLREDGLVHSYNRRDVTNEGLEVRHYYGMLEGQVAGISSKHFSGTQVLSLLGRLRQSAIYREDQNSYMLYPNRELKGFREKNRCPLERQKSYPEIAELLEKPENPLIKKSLSGDWHFNSSFKNRGTLLDEVGRFEAKRGQSLSPSLKEELLALFEEIFEHKEFTGRSGTFFGYEGLGSIYWHMVSKLLLAAQEALFEARNKGDDKNLPLLREKYYDIRRGIGFNKSPSVYGAFPIDPYSHTPRGKGAKQPGMTGQVKEEVLTRFAELGLLVEKGRICFDSFLLSEEEFLKEAVEWEYVDVDGRFNGISLEPDSLALTFCQVPIIVRKGEGPLIVSYGEGKCETLESNCCTPEISRAIFAKEGTVKKIEVSFRPEEIRD
ncbi:MAG: hypothetical protein PQJ59_13040 [Spirochaetales bacterium]|nr:hypothetical protein [Spirochaetales bacterium]